MIKAQLSSHFQTKELGPSLLSGIEFARDGDSLILS